MSGSGLAVAFDQVRIDCSCISSVGMNTDEDNDIRSKKLMLEKAENKAYMFVEKCLVIRSYRGILQVEYIIDIMTP